MSVQFSSPKTNRTLSDSNWSICQGNHHSALENLLVAVVQHGPALKPMPAVIDMSRFVFEHNMSDSSSNDDPIVHELVSTANPDIEIVAI